MDDQQPPIGEQPGDPSLDRPAPTSSHDGLPAADAAGRPPRPAFDHVARAFGRGLATAAVVVAAVGAAGAIGVAAGLLTLFGWGLAIAVAILAVGVAAAIQPRPANGWLLVPVLALAVPAVAVAVSGVRVLPQQGTVVEVPTAVAQIPDEGYRAGLGDLLVDLRNLSADDGDQIVVRAGSDLGRTVVALPRSQCFDLDVRWQTGNLRLPRVRERPTVTGLRPKIKLNTLGQQGPNQRKRYALAQGRISLFGRAYGADRGHWVAPATYDGAPTLTIELASEGGSFVVRDYPDDVAPLHSPAWPIDQVPPPYPAVVRRQELRAEMQRAQRVLRATTPTPVDAPPAIRSKPPGSVVMIDRQGNLTEASTRDARKWRRVMQRRQAFGREWAQRVAGACNRPGTFR